ncbi:MAG: hypothetical protein ABJC13_03600 [Acidobacteriota bacterium]
MRRLDSKAAKALAFSLLLLAASLGAGAAAGGIDFDRFQGGACRSDQAAVAKAEVSGCAANDQCGADEFCARLYGECAKPGACETRPKDCAEHGHSYVKPMCGCDGKTYDNACLAGAAGTSVDHDGPCAGQPAP